MPAIECYEVLIVGGGKAGKTLAADLARHGHHVALVERGMIGGTCINVGCIPSKTLIRSATISRRVAHASHFGILTPPATTDMPAVRERTRAVVSRMVELNRHNLHGALGDRFILGEARFVAPRTVEVRPADGGPSRRLTGEKVFINLGASAIIPPIPGLLATRPMTSTAFLELGHLPRHLIVIGGGYIGVELGQACRSLGSRVTIVHRGPHLLPTEDVDISEAVEAILREDGVELVLDARVSSAAGSSGERVTLQLETSLGATVLQATDILVATGRTPMTKDVGLESAGVDVAPSGTIRVNERLETTAPNTWALGDCAGTPQQTHASLDDYRIVRANVFGAGGRTTAGRLIPHTVFTDPELGRVGLTELQARRRGSAVAVLKVPMTAVPRAPTLGETRGFMKAVIDPSTQRILGFAMLGHAAGEVTAVVQLAMIAGLPFTALRDGILAHPTMAEGLNILFASAASHAPQPRSASRPLSVSETA